MNDSILSICLVMLGTVILVCSRQKLINEIASLKLKISIMEIEDITFRTRIRVTKACRWCGYKDIFSSVAIGSSCHCSSCGKNGLGNIKE